MIIADTHALIWWITDPSRLSRLARSTMDRSDAVGVASISCFEIASLAHRQRIAIHEDVLEWLRAVTTLPQVVLLPLTIDVASTAATLPDPIRDPADRLIVSTALRQGVPLVTKDHKIVESGVVPTIW